jgi:peptidoglycan/xylan/chitin deacetylase (PgdA/CDA1 family)
MHGSGKRLLMLVTSLAYFAVRTLCRTLLRLVYRRPPSALPVVLMYHAVRKGELPRFERQMRYLEARTTTVFADDAASSNGRQTVAVTFDDAFQNVFDHALPVMDQHDIPATIFAPTGFLGAEPGWMTPASRAGDAPGALVSARTLAACDRRRVRVASHTVTHPLLATLEPGAVQGELAQSKGTLEAITGARVSMLAFPYGSFNPSVLAEARRAGYDRAFANVPLRSTAASDSMLRGRITVSPRDWPLEFRLKAQGAYEWLAFAIPAKRVIVQLLGARQQS